jgi:hypothetical protein
MKKCFLLAILILTVTKLAAQEQRTKDVITFEVGDFLVSAMSEGQQSGRSDMLIDATPELLKNIFRREHILPRSRLSGTHPRQNRVD